MLCAICYHLRNFKKGGKDPMEECYFLKTLLNVTLLHGVFLSFSNCENGTKSRITFMLKAFQMYKLLILGTIQWLQKIKKELSMG